MENNKFMTKRQFLEITLGNFLYRIKKENQTQEQIEGLYHGYKRLLENQLKVSPEKAEQIEEFQEVLDNTYNMFSNSKVKEKIMNSELTKDEILEKYSERILGDNKRTYDMSMLFNENLIGTSNTQNGKDRNIYYRPIRNDRNGETNRHEFVDYEGRRIILESIGELYYKTAFGVEKGIDQYRVSKQVNGNSFISNEIFASISIIDMSNPKYRDAVLSELLGDKNIDLSNAGGYVGTISRRTSSLKSGQEEINSGLYTYKINDKYCIEYDAEDVTAATLYQRKKEKENRDCKSVEWLEL